MSVKETAVLALKKAEEIGNVADRVKYLASLILEKRQAGQAVLEYSDADKQKIIAQYEAEKALMKALVSELP